METIYNVDFFINKFEAIPEHKICEGSIIDKCAYYHCDNAYDYDGPIARHFTALAVKHLSNQFGTGEMIFAGINDGMNKNYQQPTPKQRILAALYDIKGNSAVNEAVAIASQSSPENILA